AAGPGSFPASPRGRSPALPAARVVRDQGLGPEPSRAVPPPGGGPGLPVVPGRSRPAATPCARPAGRWPGRRAVWAARQGTGIKPADHAEVLRLIGEVAVFVPPPD